MPYKPEPIDTAGVTLDDDLIALTEVLSKNAHDRWAQQRLKDGWRYGPKRDDQRKEHPCLVPYEALPESEKAYDRTVALDTLRATLALGYRLAPPAPGDGPIVDVAPRIQAGPAAAEVAEMQLPDLLTLCRTRDPDLWSWDAEMYERVGDRALQLGEPLLACDRLWEGLKVWSENIRLRQLHALALARAGATERANALLQQLDREALSDEETLGLLARTHKDLGLRSSDPALRRRELTHAYEAYVRGYRLHGGYWPGINAANLALVLGQRETALALAREVHQRCLAALDGASGGARYWVLATLGEAALILGELSEAEQWYGRAAEAGRGRWGDLSSTRRNARLLLEHLPVDPARIERCFRIPKVLVFTGHMIDAPGRSRPRFPLNLEAPVSRALRERIERLHGGVGFAAAACGGDILFLESVLAVGGEVHVVLPYGRERFAVDSVEIIPGATWGRRYKDLLEKATEVITASSEKVEEGSVSYDYGSLVLLGLASLRAGQLDTELVPVAVWDGRPGDQPGGTATIVERWRRAGYTVEVIDPARLERSGDVGAVTSAPSRLEPVVPAATSPQIMAILFADAVQFSKLTDEEIPRFVEHFLGPIGALASRIARPPLIKNTWGDGLYFVFDGVEMAGEFALQLAELVTSIAWTSKGLPPGLNLRIALHAGPVYPCTDPVTGRPNYIGSHVSRGARIEPITPPGQVYASQGFAALAAAERVSNFTCEYVGQTPLAKGYGTFPTYHVRRRAPRSGVESPSP